MEKLMIGILNMDFAAACAALEVMVIRMALNRLHFPRKYIYWLWYAVLFRFLCPLVLAAPVSLLPVNPMPIRQEIVYERWPEVLTGLPWLDDAVNGTVMDSLAPVNPALPVNPVQIVLWVTFILWALGAAAVCLYRLIQLIKLKRLLSTSVYAGAFSPGTAAIPIRVSDRIDGAFTLGIFRPVIYLPAGLEKDAADLILCHERIHIKRKDGLVKLLWIIATAIHWFQPLSWIAFSRMCADMEMACDEQVLWERGAAEKTRYSSLLLKEAIKQSSQFLPPAFGKSPVSRRIRNILAYKKPGRKFLAFGKITAVAALAGLFVSSGRFAIPWEKGTTPSEQAGKNTAGAEDDDSPDYSAPAVIIGGADGPTSIFIAGKLTGDEPVPENGELPGQAPEELLDSVRLYSNLTAETEPENAVRIFLDAASEDILIFHGNFGIFAFSKNDEDIWHQDLFVPETDNTENLLEPLTNGISMSRDGIHPDDRLIANSRDNPIRGPELAAAKMANGKIAVLGGRAYENGTCRLRDLWYGYYDPKEQILRQVFLFDGDKQELTIREEQSR